MAALAASRSPSRSAMPARTAKAPVCFGFVASASFTSFSAASKSNASSSLSRAIMARASAFFGASLSASFSSASASPGS